MPLQTAAQAERFLGGMCKVNVNGLIGFVDSLRKTGGDVVRKEITDGNSPHPLEQTGRKNLPEYAGVLMIPATNVTTYIASYQAGTVLTSFNNNIDGATYLGQFGDYEITKAEWDAAIMQNDVVKVNVTIRAKGYGTTTTFPAFV